MITLSIKGLHLAPKLELPQIITNTKAHPRTMATLYLGKSELELLQAPPNQIHQKLIATILASTSLHPPNDHTEVTPPSAQSHTTALVNLLFNSHHANLTACISPTAHLIQVALL